jgi:hypothetical protein
MRALRGIAAVAISTLAFGILGPIAAAVSIHVFIALVLGSAKPAFLQHFIASAFEIGGIPAMIAGVMFGVARLIGCAWDSTLKEESRLPDWLLGAFVGLLAVVTYYLFAERDAATESIIAPTMAIGTIAGSITGMLIGDVVQSIGIRSTGME